MGTAAAGAAVFFHPQLSFPIRRNTPTSSSYKPFSSLPQSCRNRIVLCSATSSSGNLREQEEEDEEGEGGEDDKLKKQKQKQVPGMND